MRLEEYKKEDATHNLRCCHAVSTTRREYDMPCIILKPMPNNKLRIVVFGDRYWKYNADERRIRYVDSYRVTKIEKS